MYIVKNRRRNSDWLVNEDDDENNEEDDEFDVDDDLREDSEFQLNLPDGKAFTIFDRRDMMVAVAIVNDQAPLDMGSSGKPMEIPMRQNAQRLGHGAEASRHHGRSDYDANRPFLLSIIEELHHPFEDTEDDEVVDLGETFENVENMENSNATDDSLHSDASKSDNVELNESRGDALPPDALAVNEVGEVVEVVEVNDFNEVNGISEYNDLNEYREIDEMAEMNAIANVAEYAEVEDTELREQEMPEQERMVSDLERPVSSQSSRNEVMNDMHVAEQEVECLNSPSNFQPIPKPNPEPIPQPNPEPNAEANAEANSEDNADTNSEDNAIAIAEDNAEANAQARSATQKSKNKNAVFTGIGLEFYKSKLKSTYVLHIPCLANFTFHGKLRFTLITGKIEVFGYVMDIESKRKTIDVYSPKRFMQIGIKAILPSSIPDYSNIEAALKNQAMLPENELGSIMTNFSPDDTLLLVERLPSTLSPILDRYFDEIDIFFEKRALQEGSHLEKDLECLFTYKPKKYEIQTFTEGCEWKQIKVKKYNMVCGGKGVGKSTLFKYLVNRALSVRDIVLCIDLDPGQTEFTPPGYISSVIVHKPLLGPGFTHITKPRKMAYIGALTAAHDPVKYMKSVNYILQGSKNDPYLGDIPWFINTMGFNKDIGLDIMINIIKLYRPEVVIQINSSEKSRNYEICLSSNLVEIQPAMSILPVEEASLTHDLIKTESSAKMREMAILSGFKTQMIRDLMTFAYFSPLITFPYYSFNAIVPLWIKFENVFLAVNEPVPERSIMKIFNATIVGLCNLQGVSCGQRIIMGTDNEIFCKIVVKPEIAPCLGTGIVRAIDIAQKKLYIITNLPKKDLARVNCLNLGSITPPEAIFLKQTYVDRPTAYTDEHDTENSQKPKRSYKYVPNRESRDSHENQTHE